MLGKAYVCDNQMDIFQYLSILQVQTPKFPSVIDDLYNDLKTIIHDNKEIKNEANYSIWKHVPNLGYRFELFENVTKEEYDRFVSNYDTLIEKYKKLELELSASISPSIRERDKISLFVSSFWLDKQRAKNG